MMPFLDAITEAANTITEILESPRGLKHPRHRAHLDPAITAVKEVMAGYFAAQGKSVLEHIKPHIEAARKQFGEASGQGKRFSSTLVPTSLHPLSFPVTGAEVSAYGEAITAAIAGAAKVLADDLETGAIASEDVASAYLRSNSLAKLTGEIADTTKDRLRDSIANAWDAGGSYDQVVKSITDTFADFSEKRAAMIAQNEVGNAYSQARKSIAAGAGFDEKSSEIESDNPCEACVDNEAAGWLPVEDSYPSGDDGPLFHVNCLCSENFRKVSGAEEE